MKIASLPAPLAGRLIFSFGFGFLLSMFSRSVANLIKEPVQTELMLSEEAISLAIGSSFFIAFAVMQLPVGVLLDKFDTRKVNASLLVLAGGGALVIAAAQDSYMLTMGRVMMGAGFAAAMMGSLKTYSLWFPQDRLPTINSIQFMIGVLGALSAAKPTEIALRYLDWRELNVLFASLTFVAAIILITVAPKHDTPHNGETLRDQLHGVWRVYSDHFFWRVVPWMFLSVGVSQGLATLYVVPWLTTVAEYSVRDAATAQTAIVAVAVINFAILGPIAEKMVKMGYDHLTLPVLGLGASMVLMGFLTLQVKLGVVPIWMAWTMTIGVTTLIFAAFNKSFPPHLSGRVYTAFNLLGFLSTAIVQWLIGRILDLFPPDGGGTGTPEGYQWAFLALLAIQGAGALWYFWATKTGFGAKTMVELEAEAKAGQREEKGSNHAP